MIEDENRYRAETEQEAFDLLTLRAAEDAERLRSERLHKVQRILSKLDTDEGLLERTYRSVCHDNAGRDEQSRVLASAIEGWLRDGIEAPHLASLVVEALPNFPLLQAITKAPYWSDREAVDSAVDAVAARFQKRLDSAQKDRRSGLLFLFDALMELGCEDERRARDATRAALTV